MGLPIWRDPDEKCASNRPKQTDFWPPTLARSTIRRRPSVHGRRANRASLRREPSGLPPRFERSPPPSVGFNGLHDPRRRDDRRVPPISSLLEAAEQNSSQARSEPPPPPVPESRNYWGGDANPNTARRRYNEYMEIGAERERQRRRQLRMRQTMLTGRLRGNRELLTVHASESTESGEERISSSPTADQDGFSQPIHTIVLDPNEPLRILRSPEPIHRNDTEEARRSNLPTPPLEASGDDSLFVPESDTITVNRPSLRRAHPLSHAWRPDSPVDGLGDRIRSPTPGDGWEIIRTTITPDESLPSAESSFASAAASRSFNTSSSSTQITDPESGDENQENSGEGCEDIEEDEMVSTEAEAITTEAFAEDIYFHEMRTPEGRQRIARHQRIRDRDGNRFALATEPARVDIGFRLIEEALESEEGRTRVLATRHHSEEDRRHFRDMLETTRRVRERQLRESRDGQDQDDTEPAVRRHYSQVVRDTVNETRSQVNDYFRRFTADTLASVQSNQRNRSPPPQYQARPVDGPLSDGYDSDDAAAEMRALYTIQQADSTQSAQVSQDEPEAHPVSPPAARSEREVSEALLTGDVQDLDSMRRIVERLAARDDVPEEWWMSMGLNLSRSRPRAPRRSNGRVGDNSVPESRVRAGRVGRSTAERGSARL
ncbi:hypothetical protein CB0940_04930 [Cercospora beticola]|uniref:Uncharacterized protein n=1 Tax=Cercospora beticola TaxID=122368 RepID=A0A2G5HJG9_CERBT|nr:hypothetical protein CB0940_04930 [Cercospora beticola]PIA92688.1 hypothetical protein CB0940_04930 [Cercospora beticola]WPB02216.1 hypothetical protein RHO25_006850 [Cercospora beticola]CAK1362922.1 unnamed protein product [Cercospora beticola]